MPLYAGQAILEIGAAETNFHELCKGHGLDYTGLDVRPTDWSITDCVNRWEPDRRFDWIVALGTVEHIGLGYYTDPKHPDGDIECVRRMARWLKPGGFAWFDVPFNPAASVQENRHFRIYDHRAIDVRLSPPELVELGRMYCNNGPKPGFETYAEPMEAGNPFHFVSRWLVKRP